MDEKKFCKSRDDKYIGGVCAGIGNYFDIDPTIVRLATLLLALASSGIVVIAYIILCFVIPYEDTIISDKKANENAQTNEKETEKRKEKLGLFLIIVGIILFCRKIIPYMFAKFLFPILILITGLLLVLSTYRDEKKKSSEKNVNVNETSNESDEKDIVSEESKSEVAEEEIVYEESEVETTEEEVLENKEEPADNTSIKEDNEVVAEEISTANDSVEIMNDTNVSRIDVDYKTIMPEVNTFTTEEGGMENEQES